MTKTSRRIGVAAFAAMFLVSSAAADLAIIVNPAYAGGELTAAGVREIFLGRSSRFPNGENAKPIDQQIGSADREQFLSLVLDMSEKRLKRHWSRLIFSGGGSPPESLEEGRVVVRWVSRNPGGIGYVDADLVDDSVKVLLVLE